MEAIFSTNSSYVTAHLQPKICFHGHS